ncbi:2-hydroxyacid dehydrogenase [Neotabrizicola sp. sgz301269]|uniref:2-hydroxyacid dehydrogenase n=1 Tax=Neotabrizicola sp. sgz301269 TaxID=3276282 RepID=UPI00376F7EBD
MERLLLTRRFPETVAAAARARFDVTERDSKKPLSPQELRAALRDYDLILCSHGDAFQPEVFADVPQPKARLLANFGAGYNHIDVAAARAAGLAVTNTPGAVTDATADIALALILMTARRLGEGERLLRAGKWAGWGPVDMLGTHVTGKRLGVVGLGRIGRAIARRCHFGFGMEILFHNRSAIADPGLPARQVPLAEVMAADFVVVSVPGSAATHHLIDADALAQMRPDGIFINVSRGDVVDEAALIAALQAGRIAGAGLDVYEFEPQVPPALIAMENVTLLPHLGTASLEVREAMGRIALDNVIACAEGRPLLTPV